MTFCQETKDFIFQNEKKDDRRFKKKEVTVLPCGAVWWCWSGLKLANPEPSHFSGRGGWNDYVLWTLWNKMVTVLARGFGRCRRRRVSVQVFRIRTRLESLSGFVLLSLLLRRSHHHQLHLHHHHEPNAPRRRRRAVHNVFGRKIFSCVCYSVHMLRSEKQLVRRRSPAFFLSFSAKYNWEE